MTTKYTPDQLRAMDDAALNDTAARLVMKWDVIPEVSTFSLYHPKRYLRPDQDSESSASGDAINWQFAADDDAALALVDELIQQGWKMEMSVYPGATFVDGKRNSATVATLRYDYDMPDSLNVLLARENHESRPRAITIACILAAQEIGDHDSE